MTHVASVERSAGRHGGDPVLAALRHRRRTSPAYRCVRVSFHAEVPLGTVPTRDAAAQREARETLRTNARSSRARAASGSHVWVSARTMRSKLERATTRIVHGDPESARPLQRRRLTVGERVDPPRRSHRGCTESPLVRGFVRRGVREVRRVRRVGCVDCWVPSHGGASVRRLSGRDGSPRVARPRLGAGRPLRHRSAARSGPGPGARASATGSGESSGFTRARIPCTTIGGSMRQGLS